MVMFKRRRENLNKRVNNKTFEHVRRFHPSSRVFVQTSYILDTVNKSQHVFTRMTVEMRSDVAVKEEQRRFRTR